MKIPRSSGVLAHITSLPGPFGIGDLGPWARRFVNWLSGGGQSWWQVLPLSPPGPGYSPYAGTSAFAGYPMLISLEDLVEDGLLDHQDLSQAPSFPDYTVSYESATSFKETMLRRAYASYDTFRPGLSPGLEESFAKFREENASWLDDFCFMAAFAKGRGEDWRRWPGPIRLRAKKAIQSMKRQLGPEIEYRAFCQFLFSRQWKALRSYANDRGVRIIGDVPIFVTAGSTDVWSHPEIFQLDERREPLRVSGVPPDYFSKDGQYWGQPLYNWEKLAETGYQWWIDRLKANLKLVDILRLDHFRGFEAYWSIPAGAKTALEGEWVKAPGTELFTAIKKEIPELPFIAEDLGTITEEVHELRRAFDLPGMAVLQFAFMGGEQSTHLPHNHFRDQVVYSGTHDNNTTLGWYLSDIGDEERNRINRYLGIDGSEVEWDMIRCALSSVARLAIIPIQDLAGLGEDCRMNVPGQDKKQWAFRLVPWMLNQENQRRLQELTEAYQR